MDPKYHNPNGLENTATAVKDKAESFGAAVKEKAENIGSTMREKAENIGASVADTAKKLPENIKGMAGTAATKAEEAWDTTRHMAEDYGGQAAACAESCYRDSIYFIRRNPVATVLGALGVGLLLGTTLVAMNRRS